jgi:hypothetical protein
MGLHQGSLTISVPRSMRAMESAVLEVLLKRYVSVCIPLDGSPGKRNIRVTLELNFVSSDENVAIRPY